MRQVFKLAAVAATLIVSCSLPYATRANVDNRCGLNMATKRASFDIPTAPVEFLAISRKLISETQRTSFAETAPVEFVALSLELFPKTGLTGLDMSVPAAAVPARSAVRAAHAHKVKSVALGPAAPVGFHNAARLPQAKVDRISFDTPTLAPMAFVQFCMQYSEDCKVRRMAFRPRPVTLTKARRAELVKVNRDVNRAIRPQENLNGVAGEKWLVAPREGDCNDYAVTKRHELLARGWPSRALLLAEVVVPTGEHHLVLVVRTNEDDFVLDNLNWNIRPVSQIQYRWVRAQQPGNPKFWSMISIPRAAQVAMNGR